MEAVAAQRPESARKRNGGDISVVIVDASCYSLPYDCSLAAALAALGCRVSLARSEFLHASWKSATSFEEWTGFYPFSHGLAKRAGIKPWLKYVKGLEHFFSMKKFVSRMHALRPDVIHFQWLPLTAIDAWFLDSLASLCPLVLTVHNTARPFHGKVSRWQEFQSGTIFQSFNAVVVHSEFSRRQLLERDEARPEQVHVIPHGVLDYYRDLGHAQESAPESGIQEILFFGQILPYKGLDLLVEAFGRLPQSLLAQTRLRIAGKPGMDLTAILQRARELGVSDNIIWQLGFLQEQEVPALFRRASVTALPYRSIDQSGVLMTALAFDLPVVASRVGGFAETIAEGVHGHLVEPNNVDALAEALTSVLSNSGRRGTMREAIATLRTGALSWSRVGEMTLALYRSMAQSRSGRFRPVNKRLSWPPE